MALAGATCGAWRHGTPQSSQTKSRVQRSGYMREKYMMVVLWERRVASRDLQTRDLPEMERANQRPNSRCGIAAEKSRLARRDQRMSSSLFLAKVAGKYESKGQHG